MEQEHRSTVQVKLKGPEWVTRRIKPRPFLTPENIESRLDFVQQALAGDPNKRHLMWTDTADYDEKYFQLPGYSGKIRHHENSPEKSFSDAQYPKCKSKRFLPKIMVGCAISRPLKGDDGEWIRDGKVAIVIIAGFASLYCAIN